MSPAVLRIAPALLALWLAACGGKDDAQAGGDWPSFEAPASRKDEARAPLPRACSLLGAEQAQAVLLVEAGLMVDEAEACMWSGSAGVGRITMLTLTLLDNDDLAMAETVFDGITSSQGALAALVNQQVGEKTKKSGQELEDLGDAAWLSSASYGESFGPHQVVGRQLAVRKGARVLVLNVTGSSKSEGLAQRLETLARSAVPQL